MSGYYRVINKAGGYTWVQTCATLICNNPPPASASAAAKSVNAAGANSAASTSGSNTPSTGPQEEQDQSVICVNYVLR